MYLPPKMNLRLQQALRQRRCSKSESLEARSAVSTRTEGLAENQVWVIANTIEPDSHRSIILPLGLKPGAEEFLERPYVFYEHEWMNWDGQPEDPENLLGQVKKLEFFPDRVEALIEFDVDINPKAALVCAQLKRGTLREVSIGFRERRWVVSVNDPEFATLPIEAQRALRDGVVEVVFTQADLREISIVKWASNPRTKAYRKALRSLRSRSINNSRKEQNPMPIRKILDSLARLEADVKELKGRTAPAVVEEETSQPERAVEESQVADLQAKVESLEANMATFQEEVFGLFDLITAEDVPSEETAAA